MMRSLLVFVPLLLVGCGTSNEWLDESNATSEIDKYRVNHLKELIDYDNGPISKKDLKYISFFPDNDTFDIQAKFKKSESPDTLIMPTSAGKEKAFLRYGTAFFKLDGINLTMNIFQNIKLLKMEEYRDHLFLPYKDVTNGQLSYGAGRYIDLKLSDIRDGTIRIDFNKSYNPWCAYSDGFNCPIPPLDNHLPVAIRAGEKAYKRKKKP